MKAAVDLIEKIKEGKFPSLFIMIHNLYQHSCCQDVVGKDEIMKVAEDWVRFERIQVTLSKLKTALVVCVVSTFVLVILSLSSQDKAFGYATLVGLFALSILGQKTYELMSEYDQAEKDKAEDILFAWYETVGVLCKKIGYPFSFDGTTEIHRDEMNNVLRKNVHDSLMDLVKKEDRESLEKLLEHLSVFDKTYWRLKDADFYLQALKNKQMHEGPLSPWP